MPRGILMIVNQQYMCKEGSIYKSVFHVAPSQIKDVTYARGDLNSDLVMAMHQTSVESIADMASLGDLHEGAILYNIMQRYLQDKIYVRVV